MQLRLRVTRRSWQRLFAGKKFVKILVTAQTQLRSYSEQQRTFGNSNICNCHATRGTIFFSNTAHARRCRVVKVKKWQRHDILCFRAKPILGSIGTPLDHLGVKKWQWIDAQMDTRLPFRQGTMCHSEWNLFVMGTCKIWSAAGFGLRTDSFPHLCKRHRRGTEFHHKIICRR